MPKLFGVLVFILFGFATLPAQAGEVLDRVLKTKTLRCGYFIEPPFTKYNPNTQELSGLAVDLAKKIAQDLDLKIEWVEEIAFDTFGQDLKNGRYDMVCGGVFYLPRFASTFYTKPFAYVPVHGYVNQGVEAFDKSLDHIDWENVTIAGIDGEGATTAFQKMLPQAQSLILPQRSNIAEMLLSVQTKKADIAFVMPSVFEDYNKHNQGKLKQAKLGKPLYQYAVSFPMAVGAHDFKQIIDQMITQYIVSGELGALARKYDPNGNLKYPVISMSN